MHPRPFLLFSLPSRHPHKLAPPILRQFCTRQSLRSNALGSNAFPQGKQRVSASSSSKLPEPTRRVVNERARIIRRSKIATAGIGACALCMIGAIWWWDVPSNKTRLDSPAPFPPTTTQALGPEDKDDVHTVPTGTSSVPTFPRAITVPNLPSDSPTSATPATSIKTPQTEYQLLGLGIRTVSFLRIQVYVVGIYVAVPDISVLQTRLIRALDPVATTLVPAERDRLRQRLLDPLEGDALWDAVLKEPGIRSVVRVVPVRNTDLAHLRDGFVRGITARAGEKVRAMKTASAETPQAKSEEESGEGFDSDAFGESVGAFKALWGGSRKALKKGETLLLARDAEGVMAAFIDERATAKETESATITGSSVPASPTLTEPAAQVAGPPGYLGSVIDERVSRLIWLGYLAGANVSSEAARQSVVEGVMDIVERPVGTVAMQVL